MDTGDGCRCSAGRRCARLDVGKFGGQIMVIGDDDGQPGILGDADPLRLGDAGVAGQQQLRRESRLAQKLLQFPGADAMAFAEAVGHVKANALRRGQFLQRGHQQGRAGLAVHVEVAPHEDILALADGIEQRARGALQADQRGRRRRRVGRAVEKRERLLRRVYLPLGQQLRHQGMPADRGAQRRRGFNLRQQDPGLGGHYQLCLQLCSAAEFRGASCLPGSRC